MLAPLKPIYVFLAAAFLAASIPAEAMPIVRAYAAAPHETLLYSFTNGTDGAVPDGSLIADARGNLYGTTRVGGLSSCSEAGVLGCGTVFELVRAGSKYVEKTLYVFTGKADGAQPVAGLIADKAGALYGTTRYGGGGSCETSSHYNVGCGTVFKLTPSGKGYSESVVYAFKGGSDGATPLGNLIADASGALYGTTVFGGSTNCKQVGIKGCGTVFTLTPSGSGYAESLLYVFQSGKKDGAAPAAGLVADANGVLYGTTSGGGANKKGTVFALTPGGTGYSESILYAFKGGSDGADPASTLILDSAGALYGTTEEGAPGPGCTIGSHKTDCGTVFTLTPAGHGYTESIIYRFQGGSDGFAPFAGLVADAHGNLFGTTYAGGSGGAGTVFELTPSGSTYSENVLLDFTYAFRITGGAFPAAGLIIDKHGKLYGATELGGAACVSEGGCGAVFELTL